MDYSKQSLRLHKEHKGKFSTQSKIPISDANDLSLVYSPGVAAVCTRIHEHPQDIYEYTSKSRTVAVVSDGSAVLGLGNIGPKAALPVMEGKAALFKEFANVDAVPLCLDTQDTQEIIDTVVRLSVSFGGINLEDISAPRCFEIEQELKKRVDIPVFHDDQHGTAIVIAAGLINALLLADKELSSAKIVLNGSGAAGMATAKLLVAMGANNLVVCDSKGAISSTRTDLSKYKQELVSITNPHSDSGGLSDVIVDADVFIGVSVANVLSKQDVSHMNNKPIIFALANPDPEIPVEHAKQAGAFIIATGRSDTPNQINNVLVFPGLFDGLLTAQASTITDEMKIAAAQAIASVVTNPQVDKIVPTPFESEVVKKIREAVISCV